MIASFLFILQVNVNLYKLYRAKLDDESTWKVALDGVHKGLQVFEDDLTKRGVDFFGGSLHTNAFQCPQ